LQAGDSLSIFQLLMGLMLPSGNDASIAIAETMGKIIQKHKKK
jgi:D-alanyl-D-alanine carboxypeptidase